MPIQGLRHSAEFEDSTALGDTFQSTQDWRTQEKCAQTVAVTVAWHAVQTWLPFKT